ncbi:MAG: alpha/beta fold hydrolase [Thermoguttaceae bacterium]|jgi:dienelactone hydrolase
MRRNLICAIMALLAIAGTVFSMTDDQRREYRDKLLQLLPEVPSFKQWIDKTGELPPDFDAMPKNNSLPDPLKFLDGKPVQTQDDWKTRRAEIRRLFEKYEFGSLPPHPKLDRATVTEETQADGYRTRKVQLEFGPESKGRMHATLLIPDGKGPFPVLMGPGLVGGMFGNSSTTILRRGYIVAGYSGNDRNDDSASLAALYPEYDFATLPRRAWAATMLLDYFQTMPEVDMARIGIYGYSRDGKQVMIAAAIDERIGAVIAGSTGVGGALPFRLAGERNAAEGIESTTRMFPDWFHPRLRYFSGREDRLPVDGNLLTALIAPRACLIEYGLNDEVSNSWGNEQDYYDALKVYKMLGQPQRLGILRVPGFHGANDMTACMDWMDIQFGRSDKVWNNKFLFPWDFDQWQAKSQEKIDLDRYPRHEAEELLTIGGKAIASTSDWEKKAGDLRKSVEWLLGDESPRTTPQSGREGGEKPPGQPPPDVPAWVIRRSGQSFGWLEPEKSQTATRKISFGDNLRGDLYYPANAKADAKLPTVIWLHGYSYPLGYMWVYRRDLHPILALVKAGYAVLAYDQCGFGSRMSEAGPFYDRYPHWSQFGRMMADARAAVDALQQDNLVDPERIYLFGYTIGGAVGLHAAALDQRIKGVVSICGFTPMRTDTADKGTGGIARFSHQRGLIPRLGFFIDQESRIPYDYDGLLGAIAPRPMLVVQPELDRGATAADVRRDVEQAKKVYALYNAENKLMLDEPWDYARLPTSTQERIIKWMSENMR